MGLVRRLFLFRNRLHSIGIMYMCTGGVIFAESTTCAQSETQKKRKLSAKMLEAAILDPNGAAWISGYSSF